MTRVKIILATVLAVIALVLLVQNREPVEATLLIMTVTMSKSLLLLIMLGFGFLIGMLVTGWMVSRKKHDKRSE